MYKLQSSTNKRKGMIIYHIKGAKKNENKKQKKLFKTVSVKF